MITSGFFNSVNGDRRYNAEQMSNMFEGLISGGVFESVGNKFQVGASSGMNVIVGTGRAIVDRNWIRNDAVVSVPISASHVSLNRYTLVVLRKSEESRTITLETKDGTPAASPTAPALTRSGGIYEICLAKVYVAAGATSITAADITDTRADSSVCGYVTGLIEQVDTSEILAQWEAAYAAAEDELESDAADFSQQARNLMASEQAAFMSWFDELTANLRVETYIQKYTFSGTPASLSSTLIAWADLTPASYAYAASDVITVHINGLLAKLGTDYTITSNGISLSLLTASSTALVDVEILKSRIGSNTDISAESLTPAYANVLTFTTGEIGRYTSTEGRYLAVGISKGNPSGNLDIESTNAEGTNIKYQINTFIGDSPQAYAKAALCEVGNDGVKFSAYNPYGQTANGDVIVAMFRLNFAISSWPYVSLALVEGRKVSPASQQEHVIQLSNDTANAEQYLIVAASFGNTALDGSVDDGLMLTVDNGSLVERMSESGADSMFTNGVCAATQVSGSCEMVLGYVSEEAGQNTQVRVRFSSAASGGVIWVLKLS